MKALWPNFGGFYFSLEIRAICLLKTQSKHNTKKNNKDIRERWNCWWMLLAKLLYKPTFCFLQMGFATLGPFVKTAATAKLQDDTPDSNTTHYSLIYGKRAREGPAHNLGKNHRTPNPSTEVTFIRFMHFIVAWSVLLEEAGKMCLFRRKTRYLYLPVRFIIQQPMATFKDWQHSPREQPLGTDASRERH